MYKKLIFVSVLLCVTFFCGVQNSLAVVVKAPPGEPSSSFYGFAPGVLVVNFKEPLNLAQTVFPPAAAAKVVQTGLATLDALNTRYNVTKIEKLFPGKNPPPAGSGYRDLSRYYLLEFPVEVNLDEIAADYSQDPNIVTAEKDPITYIDISTPNDPIYIAGDQWPINYPPIDYDLDMLDAWDYERGDSAVLLGIIDTGILRTHIDLGGTVGKNFTDGNIWINWPEYNGTASVDDDSNGYIDDWWGWDYVTAGGLWPGEEGGLQDNDPSDFNGHGTHVSGIAAALTNNSLGIAGVAGGWRTLGQRGCKVMALRIGYSYNDGGVERGLVQSSRVGVAVEYARDKKVTAINMSFGIATLQPTIDGVYNSLLDGIIVVHSAGNDNDTIYSVIDTLTVLGTTNQVMSVASTEKGGGKSDFSTYGGWVDVSAPGGGVWSSYSDHYTMTYAKLSGTSMSSPHVVGLAGLMKSNFPDATGEEIREWIITTSKNIDTLNPGYAGRLGSGLINAKNFFSAVPVARFGYSTPTRGHVPFAVSFSDSSLGPVDSLFWDFGDGNSSTLTNPTQVYTTPGLFTVKQRAWSDSFGTLFGLPSEERKDNLVFVIADSVHFGEGHAGVGEKKIPLPVYYRNIYPVTDLYIPIRFNGIDSLRCDSVTFNNSRIASFLVKSASLNNTDHTILIEGSGLTPLAPGAGLLATAYFSLDSSVSVGDTSSLDTAIIGSTTLEVVSTDPQAGTYDPKFIQGFLAVEPWPRGDVNKNGKLDLSDVILLVNHIFKAFPAPNPYWLGDFSADGKADLVDVIQMVNRIFKGI